MSASAPSHDGAPTANDAASPQPNAPAWAAHMSTFAVDGSGAAAAGFPQLSASTAAILERLQGRAGGPASGSAAFEATRAEMLQQYVTSDTLPPPPPPARAPSARGSGSGRGRGRGRGRGARAGRGGKRRRSESDDDDDDDHGTDDDRSDGPDADAPLPTRTKSGRSVIKPVAFVPTLPAPSSGLRRRKSTKTLLAAKCKTCHRDVDPPNNRIVFCDACSTAYHQYCHAPPIDHDVVTVLEKEWVCAPCRRTRETVVAGADELVAAASLSVEEKRAYLSTLPHAKVVSLLLIATIRHPELPIFPPNVKDLTPDAAAAIKPDPPPSPPSQSQPPSAFQNSTTSPPNGHTSTNQTPHSHNFSGHSGMDPAEAPILGESRTQDPPPSRSTTMDLAGHQYEEDDGYDTDPPAHYPKAGQGLARTLRPESEDLNWLVDDNFEVFSHGWKGDGTGMGADATLDGMSNGGRKVV